jgi:glycosyltransferase involved in cell wall biosynthesis
VVDDVIKKLSVDFEVSRWIGRNDSSLLSKTSILFLFRHTIYDYQKKPFEKWLFENDEVQIHNNFPLLTRANLKSLRRYAQSHSVLRIAHNYRMTCLRGTHFRKGTKCNLCSRNSFSPGILRGCFRRNYILSAIVAKNTKLLTKIILESENSKFIGVSHHVSNYINDAIQSGAKIETIVNKIEDPMRQIASTANEALYLGRLDPEKDILKFLGKWVELLVRGLDLPILNIVGSGQQERQVNDLAKQFPSQIIVHGYLTETALEEVLENCKIFVFTSGWNEPFGRTLIEAASRGMFLMGVENPILRTLIDTSKNGIILEPGYSNLEDCISVGSASDFTTHLEESQQKFKELYAISNGGPWVQFYRERGRRISRTNLDGSGASWNHR